MQKITSFLGRKVPLLPPSEQSASDIDVEVELPGAANVARLIEFYRRLDTLPLDQFDAESVQDIRFALEEGRIQDALDLVDFVIEADVLPPQVDESPIEGAKVARYGGIVPCISKSPLRVVGAPAQPALLSAGLTLHSNATRDWRVRCGEFHVGADIFAKIDLGLKGELVFVLLSGCVTVHDGKGETQITLAANAGQRTVRQIVYCGARDTQEHLIAHIYANDGPAHGIWCDSSRVQLSEEDRCHDPDEDLFFVQEFHDIEASAIEPSGFCSHAELIDDDDRYKHFDSIQSGELARFAFRSGTLSRHECWSLEGWKDRTAVVGITSGQPTGKPQRGSADRNLADHAGIELFVMLDGVVWVAVREDPPPGGPERNGCKLSDGPAYVTALAIGGGAHDVMLLDSSHHHAVWTTPGSDARFVHATFCDPLQIRPEWVCEHGRDSDNHRGETVHDRRVARWRSGSTRSRLGAPVKERQQKPGRISHCADAQCLFLAYAR